MDGNFLPFSDNTFGYLNAYTAFGYRTNKKHLPSFLNIILQFGPLWLTSVTIQATGLYLFWDWTDSLNMFDKDISPCDVSIAGKFIFLHLFFLVMSKPGMSAFVSIQQCFSKYMIKDEDEDKKIERLNLSAGRRLFMFLSTALTETILVTCCALVGIKQILSTTHVGETMMDSLFAVLFTELDEYVGWLTPNIIVKKLTTPKVHLPLVPSGLDVTGCCQRAMLLYSLSGHLLMTALVSFLLIIIYRYVEGCSNSVLDIRSNSSLLNNTDITITEMSLSTVIPLTMIFTCFLGMIIKYSRKKKTQKELHFTRNNTTRCRLTMNIT